MKNDQLIKTAKDSVKDCLSDISFIKTDRNDTSLNNLKPDSIFHIVTPLGPKKLYVEIKDNGQPRYACALIDKLSLLKEESKKYWIFVAPFI